MAPSKNLGQDQLPGEMRIVKEQTATHMPPPKAESIMLDRIIDRCRSLIYADPHNRPKAVSANDVNCDCGKTLNVRAAFARTQGGMLIYSYEWQCTHCQEHSYEPLEFYAGP